MGFHAQNSEVWCTSTWMYPRVNSDMENPPVEENGSPVIHGLSEAGAALWLRDLRDIAGANAPGTMLGIYNCG